jgi:hypothetical protein
MFWTVDGPPTTLTLGPKTCEFIVAPTAITEGAVASELIRLKPVCPLLKNPYPFSPSSPAATGDQHAELRSLLEVVRQEVAWHARRLPADGPCIEGTVERDRT